MARNKATNALWELQAELVKSLLGMDIRLHASSRKIPRLKPMKAPTESDEKPDDGIWYDVGADWLRFCTNEHFWFAHYIYEVKVDTKQLLCIRNIRQFNAFEQKYRIEPRWLQIAKDNIQRHKEYCKANLRGKALKEALAAIHDEDCFPEISNLYDIDWQRIAEKYPGVEIAPYLWKKRHTANWYYNWDCASGVVWDINVIKSFDLFCHYDREFKVFKERTCFG